MRSCVLVVGVCFFFKQKTAYEMRISDWSSDVCSSDLLATLREQGITGKRAEAIADKLEAKRKERFRTALAPMPPMPPMAPVAWAPSHGHAMAVARCGTGKAASTVDQEEIPGGKRSRHVMIACADGAEGQSVRLSAVKQAREAFAEGEHARRRRSEDDTSE